MVWAMHALETSCVAGWRAFMHPHRDSTHVNNACQGRTASKEGTAACWAGTSSKYFRWELCSRHQQVEEKKL